MTRSRFYLRKWSNASELPTHEEPVQHPCRHGFLLGVQNNLPGFIPVFSKENRLEPGICGTLRHRDGPPESVTQTPEDRRAADSAVEVLGAAATPAGFTVRTLKLLVTATRT